MYAVPVVLMALSAALAAPASLSDPEHYTVLVDSKNMDDQVIMPQKKAALVLDRLLVALQKALHEDGGGARYEADRDGPRTAPLRISGMEANDLTGLQRRGQGSTRGRVLRCYFNAVTCF
ncbi:uncharacterized protein [Epargyreus clarus]|uniref:uncharacterized protein n=1 Tax=Epargyreus clarus TaxID=520877 RepID=UPI003C2ED55F